MKISYEGNGELLEFDDCVNLAHRVIAKNVEDATRYAAKQGVSESDGKSAVEWFFSNSKGNKADREFWFLLAGSNWDEDLIKAQVKRKMEAKEVIYISHYFGDHSSETYSCGYDDRYRDGFSSLDIEFNPAKPIPAVFPEYDNEWGD